MRALTPQEAGLLTLKHYGTWSRVDVDRNGAGVWVDLTTLQGINWLIEETRSGDIDNPVDSLTVTLQREVGPLSLSPLVQTSPLNQYLGSYVPMLDTHRGIRVYEAMVPAGAAPQASDWRWVFDGRLDPVDAGGDGLVALQARDLGGLLQDTFIETVRIYGDDAVPVAAETVMQSILTDAFNDGLLPAAVTLYAPVSPGFGLRRYAQQKEPILDALRKVAQLFGWDVRYKWRAATAQFELTLFGPDRTKVVPDRTFYPSEIRSYGKAAVDKTGVRNVVRIVYGGAGSRQVYTTSDASSITRYGRRYFEVTEAATSQIDTVGEATTMANAILADLKDPVLDAEPEAAQFWAGELGDLYRFKAGKYDDGPVFSSDQDLAVRSFRSIIRGDGDGTSTFGVGGKPSAGYMRWMEMQGRPGVAPSTDLRTPTTPGNAAGTAGMGSIEITYDQPTDVDWDYSEFHVSAVNGFTPDGTTLKLSGKTTRFRLGGLQPGATYYAKVIAVNKAGNRSLASSQVQVAAAAVTDIGTTRGGNVDNLWPNPTSENAPPSGYSSPLASGCDPEFDFRDNTMAYAGSWSRKILATNGVAGVGPIPVTGEKHLGVRVSAMPGDQFYIEAQVYVANIPGGGGNSGVRIYFLDASDNVLQTTNGTTSLASWNLASAVARAPASTCSAMLVLQSTSLGGGSTIAYFDAVYARRVITGGAVAVQQATCTNNTGMPTDGTHTLASGAAFPLDSNWCVLNPDAYSISAGRLYVKAAGLYFASPKWLVDWSTGGTPDHIEAWVRVNGGTKEYVTSGRAYTATPAYCYLSGSTTLQLAKNDYVEFGIDFGSGSLWLYNGYAQTALRVIRLE